jgi:hypothetical protein
MPNHSLNAKGHRYIHMAVQIERKVQLSFSILGANRTVLCYLQFPYF